MSWWGPRRSRVCLFPAYTAYCIHCGFKFIHRDRKSVWLATVSLSLPRN
jgi:hypothetical protein